MASTLVSRIRSLKVRAATKRRHLDDDTSSNPLAAGGYDTGIS
jgi:hypothetical protein